MADDLFARRYRLQLRLDQGGVCEVYRAFDVVQRRAVAIKRLPPAEQDPARRRQFVREAALAAAVRHRHIVTVHAVDRDERGCPYQVMELVEGMVLRTLLGRDGRLAEPRAVRMAIQLGEALAALHTRGIVHRDVGLNNALIARGRGGADVVKLFDFGIARRVTDRRRGDPSTRVEGTPSFMAPEVTAGRYRIHPRLDVYGLGSLLLTLVTGRAPRSPALGDVSPALASILRDAIAEQTEQRTADVAGLVARLRAHAGRAARSHKPTAPRAVTGHRRSPTAAPRITVIDRFLPPAAFAALGRALRRQELRAVSWPQLQLSPDDGTALVGPTIWCGDGPATGDRSRRLAVDSPSPNRLFPTGLAVDRFVVALRGRTRALADAIGRRGQAWGLFTATTWGLPAGAGRRWLGEAGPYRGFYVYYATPELDPTAGGELLVQARVSNSDGQLVLPRPNRLVVVQLPALVKLAPVGQSLGGGLLRLISGFFVARA